jgi:hypothetical protein
MRRNLLAIVMLTLFTAGCGLGIDETARPITSVPFSLLESTTSTSEPAPEDPAFALSLFWISEVDESLISLVRPQDDPPSVQDALDALVGGPTEAELEIFPEARSPSSVSETLSPTAGPIADGILIIEVADGTELRGANRLPAAVIVCTVTQFSLVDAVEIRDVDGAIQLSGLNSESIEGAATRANFNDCEPTVPEG